MVLVMQSLRSSFPLIKLWILFRSSSPLIQEISQNLFDRAGARTRHKISLFVRRSPCKYPQQTNNPWRRRKSARRLGSPLKSSKIEPESVEGVKNGLARSFPVHGSPNVNFNRRNERANERTNERASERASVRPEEREEKGETSVDGGEVSAVDDASAKPTKRQSPGTARIHSHARRASGASVMLPICIRIRKEGIRNKSDSGEGCFTHDRRLGLLLLALTALLSTLQLRQHCFSLRLFRLFCGPDRDGFWPHAPRSRFGESRFIADLELWLHLMEGHSRSYDFGAWIALKLSFKTLIILRIQIYFPSARVFSFSLRDDAWSNIPFTLVKPVYYRHVILQLMWNLSRNII